MGIIDFILNLAGLLLWLNWRALRFDPLGKRTPATLIGTLRRAEPRAFAAMAFAGSPRRAAAAARGVLLADRSGVELGGGNTGSGRHRTLVSAAIHFGRMLLVFHFAVSG